VLSFIMIEVGSLDTKFIRLYKLTFIVGEMNNFRCRLYVFFLMPDVGKLLENKIDSIV
jgi:hypothetical protein